MSNHPLATQVRRHLNNSTDFELPRPTPGKKLFVLCPVSGGIDSTAVAIVMAVLYPNVPVTFVYTSTGIDADGTEDLLQGIERLSGRKVIRIQPAKDLLEITAEQGNFLPSQRQRWCTQLTKIKPFLRFMKALEVKHPDAEFVSLVGIRADEPSRSGVDWGNGNVKSLFPLRDLGLDKASVNKLVHEVLGIPHYYSQKSRSGCFVCIFSRRSEIIGMHEKMPLGMARASATECLPLAYEAILSDFPKSVSARTGVSSNWLRMAIPSQLGGAKLPWQSQRGVVKRIVDQTSLFEDTSKTFYVAVEHHYGPNGSGKLDVYYQNLINYSTSMGGLTASLKHYWEHKFNTKELFGHQDETELRDAIKIAIYVVSVFDAEHLIPDAPKDIYTWQNDGKPLALIKKTSYLLKQILLEEGVYQDAKSGDPQASALAFKIKTRTGEVLHGSLYEPMQMSELLTDMDITDAPVMCNACSR